MKGQMLMAVTAMKSNILGSPPYDSVRDCDNCAAKHGAQERHKPAIVSQKAPIAHAQKTKHLGQF
jgi:hypothetical protein